SYSQNEAADKAVDLYNQTVQAAQSEDFATAIAKAKEAYETAKTAEGAEETKTNLEKLLPKLYLSKAKKDLDDDKFDEALNAYKQAEDEAKKLNDAETAKDAAAATIKVYLKQADQLYSNNEFDAAIKAFDKALAIDSSDAKIYQIKASAFQKKGATDDAVKAFEKARDVASATGNSSVANSSVSQLAAIFTKAAAEAQKTKKWADVVKNAEKVLEYKPGDGTALKLIDLGNYQQGAALQATNKTKACQFFKKVKTDEKMKAGAAAALKALGCS
ncbi:MAG: tetratricopeptide repeat protein, partial [Prevotellaceae bacterium]|nr:tetratricopeptide repeat protein [Prevotellaceae bacterium]